jgi:hypothetical protein
MNSTREPQSPLQRDSRLGLGPRQGREYYHNDCQSMFPRSTTTGARELPEFAPNQALKQNRRNPLFNVSAATASLPTRPKKRVRGTTFFENHFAHIELVCDLVDADYVY